jgi:hypothetical protein
MELLKKDIAKCDGSLTHTGYLNLTNRNGTVLEKISDAIPFANVKNIVLGGWDSNSTTAYDAAVATEIVALNLKELDVAGMP